MQARTPIHLALVAAAAVLFAAGCDQRNAPSGSSATPGAMTSSTTAATTSASDRIDDAAITTKVKAALMAEPGLRSLEIDVDTRDNIVTLNGTVDSQEKKQRAMQLAQGVQGVKSVSDNLVVKPS